MEVTQLPKSIARLTTPDGFIESYQEKMRHAKTCKEAYEMAEEEYRILFGTNRYSSYPTFKNAITRWNKKRRTERQILPKRKK